MTLSHDTIVNWYKTNFLMIQEYQYSLTEIENMMPWEREVYISLLLQHQEKKINDRMNG